MRKKRTILWGVILLLILGGLGYAWYLYDKPHRSAASASTDVTIRADTLFHQYQADEHAADQRYMGKVLAVSGTLSEIQHSGGSEIWILAARPGGVVNCQLFAGTRVGQEPKPGDAVTVKGRCTGFLIDNVTLTDCVPSK